MSINLPARTCPTFARPSGVTVVREIVRHQKIVYEVVWVNGCPLVQAERQKTTFGNTRITEYLDKEGYSECRPSSWQDGLFRQETCKELPYLSDKITTPIRAPWGEIKPLGSYTHGEYFERWDARFEPGSYGKGVLVNNTNSGHYDTLTRVFVESKADPSWGQPSIRDENSQSIAIFENWKMAKAEAKARAEAEAEAKSKALWATCKRPNPFPGHAKKVAATRR